ncbi:bifunctional 3,4-dihydroxy-2-butanone-4-phosphate synthase/GTP cyclohydrolase II [Dasania marina]|uniref:bifunctional 3,4-dihydroxy-2-butanone-4-phosphate synthase/GTP cyclohydrolase II n=1 Tax=Dasania marina TaxID=471499 RepID=UPI00036F99BD|nr:bifunctional 3,4-dihydroxy-2-butanone-4-phosphate synthase/GTP cyclohydrolase II [Dasania marina]|tara:strand:- start:19777 stop:20895 length:1119 start_codon:yes stop_codon:yes gene_type:complete
MALNTVEELIQDIRLGKMVILMDDEDRENEGDLVMASECVKPQDINFMAKHARGLICLTLSQERCQQLDLGLMVAGANGAQFGTNFTLSIEAAEGVTTGISAADRAHTVRTAVTRNAKPADIVQPGHIFPIMAQPGGVLTRAGHTEAGCDLARLAGFEASGTIVEIMNEDGTMARRPELEIFAKEHNLKIGTIADLIHYRVINERTVEKISEGVVQTDYGEFVLHTYKDLLAGDIHHAMVKGTIDANTPTLARVHLASAMRDLLTTQPNDNLSWNMPRCLAKVAEEGCGVVVLLANNETTAEHLDSVAIAMGEKNRPIEDASSKNASYHTVGLGSQILRDVGAGKLRLMGVPIKYNAISGFELEVIEHVAPE